MPICLKSHIPFHHIESVITPFLSKLELNLLTPDHIEYHIIKSKKMEDQIKKMLTAHFIIHSQSPYAAPVILVKKNDGSTRLCTDFRKNATAKQISNTSNRRCVR